MGKAILVMGIVICGTAILIALIVVGYRLVKGPAVRRARLNQALRRGDLARDAITQISAAAQEWQDVDSVLAMRCRVIIERYELELRRTQEDW